MIGWHDVSPEVMPQRAYHLHDIPALGTWPEMGNKETSDGLWLLFYQNEMSVFFF